MDRGPHSTPWLGTEGGGGWVAACLNVWTCAELQSADFKMWSVVGEPNILGGWGVFWWYVVGVVVQKIFIFRY